MDVRVGLWRRLSTEELMLLNCGVGEASRESLELQGGPTSPFWRSALGYLWREWCWSQNSSTLATSCEELTHWKRLWCWEGLGVGGEGDDTGWDGWMASLTWWTWVWVNSGSWWWTGKPGVLSWFMGLQRVGHNWVTELNECHNHLLSPKEYTPKSYAFLHPSSFIHTDNFCSFEIRNVPGNLSFLALPSAVVPILISIFIWNVFKLLLLSDQTLSSPSHPSHPLKSCI